MTDYLNDVGKGARRFAIVLLSVISLFCWCLVLLAVVLVLFPPPNRPPPPVAGLITVAVIFGSVGLLSTWILWRLIRGRRAANGKTVMPLWSIEVFGFAFGAGCCAAAIINRQLWQMTIVIPIVCAMIFVRRNLGARRTETVVDEKQAGANPDGEQ